jgi:hypothetical protein
LFHLRVHVLKLSSHYAPIESGRLRTTTTTTTVWLTARGSFMIVHVRTARCATSRCKRLPVCGLLAALRRAGFAPWWQMTGEKRRAQRSQRNTRVICTSVEVYCRIHI